MPTVFPRWSAALAALALSLLAGCGGDAVVGGRLDAGNDLSPPDVAPDAPDDSPPDAAPDAAPDVADMDAPDAAPDAAPDVADAADAAEVDAGCASDMDCAGNPAGNVCDRVTGRCVQCATSMDTCPAAQHCDPATNTCVAGCRADEGCTAPAADGGVAARRCDTATNACVECVTDAHCAGGRLCRGGVCVLACMATGCPSGQTCCTGGCVDAQTNVENCGACGTACTIANGTPACRAGACAVAMCDEGFADCDGAPGNGCEVDTRLTTAHCGGCGRECAAVPGAVAACVMSACRSTCVSGSGDCDMNAANGCETTLTTDVDNCGACGSRCPAPPNGAAACAAGICGVGACNAGFGNCDRDPMNGCETNLQTSESHCGACGMACATGLVCDAGRCVPPCPGGFTRCGSTCAALDYDPMNCGACGMRCAAGALCGSGRCVAACTTGQTACAGGCTSLQTDPENCGACGTRCPTGNTCMGGMCRVTCVTGQTICSGACADLQTSLLHCGACGNACGAGEQCMAGRCVLTCRAPQVVCGAECADLSRDPNHCGTCERVCPTGCFGGDCARVDTLSAGLYNNCARYTSGRVYCWGINGSNSTTTQNMLTSTGGTWGHRATPVLIVGTNGVPIEGITQVVVGNNRACALNGDGAVVCWGLNVALGAVSGLPAASALVARETQFCALGRDGQVYCWDGLPRASTAPALTPEPALPSAPAEIARGVGFTCARLASGAVSCWGTGTSGQLGNGASANSTTPVAVRGLTDAAQLVAGRDFACARRADRSVVCWGLNSRGQLGDNTTTTRNAPVAVMGLTDAVLLTAGLRHACAYSLSRGIVCWGENLSGQLGDGTTVNRSTPVVVPGFMVPQRVLTAYDHHTCAVGNDNRVQCWGGNTFGEANGGTELSPTPRAVQFGGADLEGLVDLQVGQAQTYALMATTQWRCALHRDGRVFCWGTSVTGNESGQLGDGTTTQRAVPQPVTGLTDARQIAVGWQHACALRAGGTVVCWGSNSQGQIGDGTNTNRPLPTPVMGITNAVEIRSGDYHTCARLMTGELRCWGYNYYGELGDSSMINRNVPVAVMAINDAVQLSAGANYNCARRASGQIHCWGRNIESQLGDGFRTNRSVPYPVQAATATTSVEIAQGGFTDFYSDYYRSYGRTGPSTVLGWGWSYPNRSSVIAALASVDRNVRVFVFGEPVDNECELRTDGSTWCRGRNEFGQIGNGTTSFVEASFIRLSADWSVIRLGRGYGSPCAVERTRGRALCWGWAGFGNLAATGATGLSLRPYEVFMP
ncbi:MAG: MXAN_6577-like cysteine-rich protein [Polyangiales bacterium]